MTHRFVEAHTPAGNLIDRCKVCGKIQSHKSHSMAPYEKRWEVKKLPWAEKKPWFAYNPAHPLFRCETWAEAIARVCEDFRERQG